MKLFHIALVVTLLINSTSSASHISQRIAAKKDVLACTRAAIINLQRKNMGTSCGTSCSGGPCAGRSSCTGNCSDY